MWCGRADATLHRWAVQGTNLLLGTCDVQFLPRYASDGRRLAVTRCLWSNSQHVGMMEKFP
jgi:hypothetical protein